MAAVEYSLTSSFTVAQLVTLAMAFVLAVGIIAGSAWWMNKPTYALLFADMDPETAGQTVTRLKNLNVQYQLDEGGSQRVGECRGSDHGVTVARAVTRPGRTTVRW